jgi:hypothetical protein
VSFRIYAVYFLIFWIPGWILWSQSAERPIDPTVTNHRSIYNSRCNKDPRVYNATYTGYCSLTITWLLQVFMLWKCRGIKESLGLVKEIKFTAVLCIIVGIVAAGSAPSIEQDASIDPFFVVNVVWILGLSYSSLWIPISAAREFRKAKQDKASKSGDSEFSKLEQDKQEKDCMQDLLNALEEFSQTPEAFKAFLCEEFAVENYLFLEAVSKLRALPSISELDVLWTNFIEVGSNYEVNLPSSGRNSFKDALHKLRENPNSADLLLDVLKAVKPLEEEIYKILKHGALFRFKLSSGPTANTTSQL